MLPAQGLSGGPLAGSAVAIGIDGGSALGPDATTLVHRNGFTGGLVPFPGTAGAFPANPGSPNLQAILAALGQPGLDADDFSTGRDDVMVDSNGVLDVPATAWGAFTFSFRNGAAGQPGSRLAQEVAEAAAMVPPATVGGVVFSYVLPGSGVPASLTNRTERSHSRTELGLGRTDEVDALDTPVVLGFDQATLAAIEPGFAAFLGAPQAIYFTLSSASAAVAPAAWFTVPGPSARSGATILRVLKSSAQGAWSAPHVWKAFYQLGLSAAQDIDALAYDEDSDKLVFSLVGASGQFDQLLFIDFGNDGGPPVPVKRTDNTPVSQAIGTGQNDDIDAVCTLDPHVRTNGGWVPDDFGASCGTPRDAYLPALYPVGMSASAFRRFTGGNRFYDTWMLGWPPATGRGPGFAALVITLGDTLSPAITASWQARVTTAANPADPRGYAMVVPATYALQGYAVTFRWFAMNNALTELAQAYPVKVFL